MRRATLALVVLAAATAVLGTAVPAGAVTSRSATAVLRQRIAAALRHSTARVVDWRFDISGVGSIRSHASRLTAPASNNKLFVAQTALDRLGPDFRFQTPVGQRGAVVGHTLHGWLAVRGSGDPLLSDAGLADLARQVKAAGIRKVTGGLLVDDSRYVHRTTAPGWRAGFTPTETGPIDAFAVDGNEWNRSRQYIAHTGADNGLRFVSILRKHHVKIPRTVRLRPYGTATTIATLQSDPLAGLVSYLLVHSYNFEAEMLLDELGAAVKGQGRRTTGLAVILAEGRRLDASPKKIVDGSGLSYADRESPNRIVRWLQATAASQTGEAVRAALPVSCRTGTLEHRLCARWAAGRVAAKTGTLGSFRRLLDPGLGRPQPGHGGAAGGRGGGRGHGVPAVTAQPAPRSDLIIHAVGLDHPDAQALRREHAEDMRHRYGGGDMKPLRAAEFAPPAGGFLVAYAGPTPVGCGGFRPLTAEVAEVKSVRVSAGHRRLGVGRRLMAAIESAARNAGYRELWLETGVEQPEALALYDALGYRPIPSYGEFKDSPRSRSLGRRIA
jgi:D-alanyl-D-alanine carboxypeptidase/GNAT superfamily N-acetyltransferase